MLCPTPLLVTTMVFASLVFSILGVFLIYPVLSDKSCPDGRSCPKAWLCCEQGCCAPSTLTPRREPDVRKDVPQDYPWYAHWPVLFLAGTLLGIFVCSMWCICCRNGSRQCSCMFACCMRRQMSDHDSSGSCYPPPHYSRCGSFHQAPPPYSEVASKPDLYPLVITCGEGDNKSGGNYLMVHYFRNYVIRAPGSLSATSTAESLNSSFICNAANEANSIIPPPYSSNVEEWRGVGCGSLLRSLSSLTDPRASAPALPRARTAPPDPALTTSHRAADLSSPDDTFRETLITSPVQPTDSAFDLELELIDYDLRCDTGCRPRLGASPPTQRSPSHIDESNVYEQDIARLRHLYAFTSPDGLCESPPQPTSPTQTSEDSTLRRTSDERRHRRHDSVKKNPKSRKSSLYMPLTSAYPVRTRISPGSRVSSRSAPATPCGGLVPNLLALSQRVSASRHSSRSSKLEEENDPLLADTDNTRDDHKF